MKLSELRKAIRHQIGEEGPQLPTDEYEARIDEIMEDMTVKRLLEMLEYMDL